VRSDKEFVDKYSRFKIVFSFKLFLMGMLFAIGAFYVLENYTNFVYEIFGIFFVLMVIVYFRLKNTLFP
jgi:hypothetical protein